MVDSPIGVTLVPAVQGEKVVRSSGIDGSQWPGGTIPAWDDQGDMKESAFIDTANADVECRENLVLPRRVRLGQNLEIQAVGEFFILDDPTTADQFAVAAFSIVTDAGGSGPLTVFNFGALSSSQVVQSDDSQTLGNTTTIAAEGTLGTGGALVRQYIFRFAQTLTNISVTVRRGSESGPIIYRSIFTVDAVAGQDALFENERQRFGFLAGVSYHLTFESPDGTPQLLGDSQSVAYYARTFQTFTIDPVVTRSDLTSNPILASQISLDPAEFDDIDSDDVQDGFGDLQRLFGIVRGLTPGGPSAPSDARPLQIFTSSVSITSSNFADFQNRNAIYAAGTNQRVNFVPPAEADIAEYPVAFEITNLGGTERFDGRNATNTVVVTRPPDYDPNDLSTYLRRGSSEVSNLVFSELHRGDVGLLLKEDVDSPWRIFESSTDPRSALLPDRAFTLNTRTVSLNPSLGFIAGLSQFTPNIGDAFEVTTGNPGFGPGGVETGDVIVSKVDGPSLVVSDTNDDWIVIRDVQNFPLTLAEIRFLAQVRESTTGVSEQRLEVGGGPRIWLLDAIPSAAPLLADAQQFQYTETTQQNDKVVLVTIPSGSPTPDELIFRDERPDGTAQESTFSDVFTDMSSVIPDNSNGRYYMLGSAIDSSRIFRLGANHVISIQRRITNRGYSFENTVDTTAGVSDLAISQLDPDLQVLIRGGSPLTPAQTAKLSGLETSTASQAIGAFDRVRVGYGDASLTLDHYREFNVGDGIAGVYQTETVQLLVPDTYTVTNLVRDDGSEITNPVSLLGTIVIDGTTFRHYQSTIPAVPDGTPFGDIVWELAGTVGTQTLSGAASTFKADRDNLSDALAAWIQSLVPDAPSPSSLPEKLQQFSDHLAITQDVSSGWSAITPDPIRAKLTREFAALWTESRRTFTGNFFEDLTDVEVIGFTGNTVFFYNDPLDDFNTSFRGAQSYILNDNVRIRNTGGGTNIGTTFRKIIGFDYALQRELGSSENFDMLRIGSSSTTALIALSEEEGLYVNIGRQDGGQRSRTRAVRLEIENNQWGTRVGQSETGESEVIIPQSLSGSITVTLNFQGFDNDVDEGTDSHDVVISDVTANQTPASITLNHNILGSRTVDLVYEADNNDFSISRRVLFLRPPASFTNAALHYVISATYAVTETWNVAATYARLPINAGSGHDDFGLFDPHLYTTEGVESRNRVLISVQKYREDDTESDPEIALHVVVDGENETGQEGFLIRTHRPASDFDFSDVSIGNSVCATAHIQGYSYTGTPPTEAELQTLYAHGNAWLGAFNEPGFAVDDVVLDANVEMTLGHGLIMTDVTTSNRTLVELDNGALTFTAL